MAETFGDKLRAFRALRGLSQFDFGKVTGIARHRVAAAEGDQLQLRPDEYASIEKYVRGDVAKVAVTGNVSKAHQHDAEVEKAFDGLDNALSLVSDEGLRCRLL